MNIVFMGPPGSGKGTYASRLSPTLVIHHISTGDLFREHMKGQTGLGKTAKGYIDKGQLVPDEITAGMLKERISKPDCAKGFILDGYPRTIRQAELLEEMSRVDIVLNLIWPRDLLIRKLAARRVCRKCGWIYNIADIHYGGLHLPPLLPKKEGVCDQCRGELYQRDDDKEQVVSERLVVYDRQTKPLMEYYRKRQLLKDVELLGAPDIMVAKILEILGMQPKAKQAAGKRGGLPR